MDYIHVEGLIVRGTHGVHPRERAVGQEFTISLRLGVDTRVAATSDRLIDAVDYQPVCDEVVSIVQENTYYLIEKLAEHIATAILKDPRIALVEVTIRKPEVWDNGMPGVTITRSKRFSGETTL
jgi:dihydroneopterin aldolase